MRTEWILVADYAEVLNGKLYTMGGGWDNLVVNSLPHSQNFAIATSFLVEWNETNYRHNVEIEFSTEDEKLIATLTAELEVGRPPGSTPGQSQRLMLAVNINHTFEALGTFVIRTKVEEEELSRLVFRVAPGPQLRAEQMMDPKTDKPSR